MIDLWVEGRVGGVDFDLRATSDDGPLVLAGPNGAGKSTLLRVVLGLARPPRGRVVVGGRVLLDTAAGVDVAPEDRGVGYVPQGYGLFPHLSARRNVEFALACRGLDRARAVDWLASMGVAEVADRRPAALSGGERQRVALARALAAEPVALLLDEPLAAVDRGTRRRLREFLAERLRALRLPAIVVTHDPADARAFGGRLHVVEAGRVTWDGAGAGAATPFVDDFFRAD